MEAEMIKTGPSTDEQTIPATQRFHPQQLIEYATKILVALDVNSRRIECQFDPRRQRTLD